MKHNSFEKCYFSHSKKQFLILLFFVFEIHKKVIIFNNSLKKKKCFILNLQQIPPTVFITPRLISDFTSVFQVNQNSKYEFMLFQHFYTFTSITVKRILYLTIYMFHIMNPIDQVSDPGPSRPSCLVC